MVQATRDGEARSGEARPGEVSSEWEILRRAQHGDEAAWRDLVARYRTRLVAIALLVTRSAAVADDVVQETYVRALRAAIKHSEGTVQAYLGTIAYRLALKETQRARRHIAWDGVDAATADPDPLDAVLTNERDRHVFAAIRGLEAGHRDVLVLRFYGGQSYEEIATLLHVPLGTVKSRIHYAVRSCRKRLREEGFLE